MQYHKCHNIVPVRDLLLGPALYYIHTNITAPFKEVFNEAVILKTILMIVIRFFGKHLT
jgi:hypothetical protein